MFFEYIFFYFNLVWVNVSVMYLEFDIGFIFWYCIFFIRIFVMDICYMMILMRFFFFLGIIIILGFWFRSFWFICFSYKFWSLIIISWSILYSGCFRLIIFFRNCEFEYIFLKLSFNINIRILSFGINFRYWKSWYKF